MFCYLRPVTGFLGTEETVDPQVYPDGLEPFELHLKECEWRYNQALPQLLAGLKLLVSKNKDLMV